MALELIIMAVSLAIAVVGLLLARRMYVPNLPLSSRMVESFGPIHKIVYNKYWMAEIYDFLFVIP